MSQGQVEGRGAWSPEVRTLLVKELGAIQQEGGSRSIYELGGTHMEGSCKDSNGWLGGEFVPLDKTQRLLRLHPIQSGLGL